MCDVDSLLWSLGRDALETPRRDQPAIASKLLENMAQAIGTRLRANTTLLTGLAT